MRTSMEDSAPAELAERRRLAYDRFGPWTYPVSTASEMPPTFDPWYAELAGSPLVIKLPVHDERRNLKPSDVLYERILAVGSQGIISLRVSAGKVERQDVPYGDISYLGLSQDLLRGALSIGLSSGAPVQVVFNTVSVELFEDFVGLIRAALPKGQHRFAPRECEPGPTRDDNLATVILDSLRMRDPGLALLAYQAPQVLESREAGGRRGIVGFAARLLPWRIDGCLLAATVSELVAVTRGSPRPHIASTKGYHYEIAYLPSTAFLRAAVEERDLANGAILHALRISLAGQDRELLFEQDPSPIVTCIEPSS
jgi:hypothetical protein